MSFRDQSENCYILLEIQISFSRTYQSKLGWIFLWVLLDLWLKIKILSSREHIYSKELVMMRVNNIEMRLKITLNTPVWNSMKMIWEVKIIKLRINSMFHLKLLAIVIPKSIGLNLLTLFNLLNTSAKIHSQSFQYHLTRTKINLQIWENVKVSIVK